MTPAARWATAAQLMDQISGGEPAEKALTNWARKSRYAGSKDRAAVRDHVFDILRNWRSVACLGGGRTGRHLVLGRLRQTGEPVDAVFSGTGYALPPLTDAERAAGDHPVGADALDLSDWFSGFLSGELPEETERYAASLKLRAPVFLRVNLLRSDRDAAQRDLAELGIETQNHPLSDTALEVIKGARQIAQSAVYLSGKVEFQDAASQAVVDALPLREGARVLDYCAGGGGKSLAMAAKVNGALDAHDAYPDRMADIPVRAERAGAIIDRVAQPQGSYDLVLADAPCSGSGAWRRTPEAKWTLTQEKLESVQALQKSILEKASSLVGPMGTLAYATCSVLPSENEKQIEIFLRNHPDWVCETQKRFWPWDGGDGFFVALLTRSQGN